MHGRCQEDLLIHLCLLYDCCYPKTQTLIKSPWIKCDKENGRRRNIERNLEQEKGLGLSVPEDTGAENRAAERMPPVGLPTAAPGDGRERERRVFKKRSLLSRSCLTDDPVSP